MDKEMKLLYAMSEIDPELIAEAAAPAAKAVSPFKRIGAVAATVAIVTALAVGIGGSGILDGMKNGASGGNGYGGSDFSNESAPELAPGGSEDSIFPDDIPDPSPKDEEDGGDNESSEDLQSRESNAENVEY